MRVKKNKIRERLFREEDNFYDLESLNRLMGEGVISGADEGFMLGYLDTK